MGESLRGWLDELAAWRQAAPDARAHYGVKVTDMPPSAIECVCGQRFTGPDPIRQMRDHMDAEEGP
jgi:hypothetical protein